MNATSIKGPITPKDSLSLWARGKKMSTAQLLADKGQLWLVNREAYGRQVQYCRITKSYPEHVIVKSFSENKEVSVDRKDLVCQVKVGDSVAGGIWGLAGDGSAFTITSISKGGKRLNIQLSKTSPEISILLRADGSWWNESCGMFWIGEPQQQTNKPKDKESKS